MKKKLNVEDARRMVMGLLGRDVDVKLNRGRNKIKHYKGIVREAHSNVFVVELVGDVLDRISCSYIDVMCGEIALREQTAVHLQ